MIQNRVICEQDVPLICAVCFGILYAVSKCALEFPLSQRELG